MNTFVYVDGFNLYYAIRALGCKWLNLKSLSEQVLPAGTTIQKVRYYTARVSGAVDPGQPARQQTYFNALATVPEIEIILGNFLAKSQWRPLINVPIADRSLTDSAGAVSKLASGPHRVGIDSTLPQSRPESIPIGKYGKGAPKQAVVALDAVKVQVFGMEEKGSDVNLAVHLVNDAWAKRFDAAAVISNDTDLVEPIRIVAKELNIPVYLLTPPAKFGAPAALVSAATSQRHIRKSHLVNAQFADPVNGKNGAPVSKPSGW